MCGKDEVMPEKSSPTLNSAARDVIAERQRQVSAEGYSLYRDDAYVKGEMAEAASVYSRLAGQPTSMSSAWPWGQDKFKPSSDRRRDLVKAGALILAEIERLDRIPLIKSWPVKRDENGFFQHPDLPDFDEGDGDKCKAWIAEQGLEVVKDELEYASDKAVADRYFEAGDPDCSYWEPDRPDGEGWFCLAIHDTDDGPVCWWARRVVTP
ncbi:hypothetical protein ALQ80_00655 [Pseudomonas coronafaciens pv. oryzae]|nr:hypothetical protein ALQ80_00655 [Pseudomonas coronafaciens pv. oryzae]